MSKTTPAMTTANNITIDQIAKAMGKATAPPPFNFGVSVIDVVSASLGFVLSLALNEAFSLSFKALLRPPETEEEKMRRILRERGEGEDDDSERDEEDSDLQSAWLYAFSILILVTMLLFVLLGCTKPHLLDSNNIPKGCSKNAKRIILPVGTFILLSIIIIPRVIIIVRSRKV